MNEQFDSNLLLNMPDEVLTTIIMASLLQQPSTLTSIKLTCKKFNEISKSNLMNQFIREQVHMECPEIFSKSWLTEANSFNYQDNLELLMLILKVKNLLQHELSNSDSEVHQWLKYIYNIQDINRAWALLEKLVDRKNDIDAHHGLCFSDDSSDSDDDSDKDNSYDEEYYRLKEYVTECCRKNKNPPPPIIIFVYLLLKAGANIDAPAFKYAGTPLNYIAGTLFKDDELLVDLIHILLAGGANINNEYTNTTYAYTSNPLNSFCRLRGVPLNVRKKVLGLFIKFGLDLNAVDQYDNTILDRTVIDNHPSHNAHISTITALIELGADIHRSKGTLVNYSLNNAFFTNNFDTARLLLKYGLNINAVNERKQNFLQAIILSSVQNLNKIVEFLIESGIDVNNVAEQSYTALDLTCIKGGKPEIAKLLRQAGAKHYHELAEDNSPGIVP